MTIYLPNTQKSARGVAAKLFLPEKPFLSQERARRDKAINLVSYAPI